MRRRGRVDSNQSRIVKELRQVGCSVAITSSLGDGFPDLVVGWRGVNYLFEIKDGTLPPSGRKLTPEEKIFRSTWAGQYFVIQFTGDALEAMGA